MKLDVGISLILTTSPCKEAPSAIFESIWPSHILTIYSEGYDDWATQFFPTLICSTIQFYTTVLIYGSINNWVIQTQSIQINVHHQENWINLIWLGYFCTNAYLLNTRFYVYCGLLTSSCVYMLKYTIGCTLSLFIDYFKVSAFFWITAFSVLLLLNVLVALSMDVLVGLNN